MVDTKELNTILVWMYMKLELIHDLFKLLNWNDKRTLLFQIVRVHFSLIISSNLALFCLWGFHIQNHSKLYEFWNYTNTFCFITFQNKSHYFVSDVIQYDDNAIWNYNMFNFTKFYAFFVIRMLDLRYKIIEQFVFV